MNSDKCKELRISFSKRPGFFDPIVIEGKELKVADSVKLLGLNIASDITWNSHILEVIKKASANVRKTGTSQRMNSNSFNNK